MIDGKLLNALRALPYEYEKYFNSLCDAADADDPSKIVPPELPDDLTPKGLGDEVQEGTAELLKITTEDLRELSNPLKIGFAYIKVNQLTPYWACYYKRGIINPEKVEDNTDIDEQGSQL